MPLLAPYWLLLIDSSDCSAVGDSTSTLRPSPLRPSPVPLQHFDLHNTGSASLSYDIQAPALQEHGMTLLVVETATSSGTILPQSRVAVACRFMPLEAREYSTYASVWFWPTQPTHGNGWNGRAPSLIDDGEIPPDAEHMEFVLAGAGFDPRGNDDPYR